MILIGWQRQRKLLWTNSNIQQSRSADRNRVIKTSSRNHNSTFEHDTPVVLVSRLSNVVPPCSAVTHGLNSSNLYLRAFSAIKLRIRKQLRARPRGAQACTENWDEVNCDEVHWVLRLRWRRYVLDVTVYSAAVQPLVFENTSLWGRVLVFSFSFGQLKHWRITNDVSSRSWFITAPAMSQTSRYWSL